MECLVRQGKIDDLIAISRRFVAAIVEQQEQHAPKWTQTMKLEPARVAELHG